VTVYLELTRAFNDGALRAILSSGQAVVVHRLAIMSKDGDWILRERPEALEHVRRVLAARGSAYRFGAPLDVRWMSGGWSAHLEHRDGALRVRTDFVTRPPRIDALDLEALWREQEGAPLPVVDPRRLVAIKQTNREKDYAVIGELARLLSDPKEQLLASRSARDIVALGARHPRLLEDLARERPLLAAAARGEEALERALDAERRALVHANERRLARYAAAAEAWAAAWPATAHAIAGMPLEEAHEAIVARALGVLPFSVGTEPA